MPDFDVALDRADDDLIAAATPDAAIHALLLALAAALDDPAFVPDHLRPDLSNPFDPNSGLAGERLEEAYELARAGIRRLRDEGPAGVHPFDGGHTATLLTFLSGGEP